MLPTDWLEQLSKAVHSLDSADWVTAIIASISLVLSSAAFFVRRREEVVTQRAQFYLQFTDRYNTPEMHDALVKLMSHYIAHRADFASIFAEEFRSRTDLGIGLDAARRLVNRYFVNIHDMYTNGLIDKQLASMLCNFQGLNIFYQVVVPMNEAKYGRLPNNQATFERLKQLRSQYADGKFGLRSEFDNPAAAFDLL